MQCSFNHDQPRIIFEFAEIHIHVYNTFYGVERDVTCLNGNTVQERALKMNLLQSNNAYTYKRSYTYRCTDGNKDGRTTKNK